MKYDVAIVGGGPAGVSAALYARARGAKIVVLDKNGIGGLISRVSLVSHFLGVSEGLSGPQFAKLMAGQLERAGVEAAVDEVLRLEVQNGQIHLSGRKGQWEASAAVLATGTKPRRLGLSGEDELGVCGLGLDRLDDLSAKEIVVVGGSDGAAKEAIHLAGRTKEVHLVFIERELAAVSEFRRAIEKLPNVRTYPASRVTSISGGEKVQRVVIASDDGAQTVLRCDDEIPLFVCAGRLPQANLAPEKTSEGWAKCAPDMATSLPGVFVAGDMRDGALRQVAGAVRDGAVAGIAAAGWARAHGGLK
ncbi:NAD(P)/FAD-dependent oxidoreductase [Jonquetella anthropi]|uniref:NAD(P)/FAD-dependent oxidoreductase n=1 Tax=Jonquetella anthropi TaxID=428712 RepID=UPI0001B90F3E|nr:NAD(P)/FAD-dependent oxidoreductase [Jonquetella anthropi]EEX48035.1 pyridine nucleotide-disulfide oxidoreductase [Jonquetella anthropi E3_33 E1]